jgi:hypothetical protein
VHLCHVPEEEVHQFVPDALSRLYDNHMPTKDSEKTAHTLHPAFLADAVFKQIATVHNSMVGDWGL